MQDCSRCKCKLSNDNFEKKLGGDLATRCNTCRTQDREYRRQTYKRRPTVADVCPELLEEWDYEKNVGLSPNKLTPSSAKKVWWICKKDSHHRWKAVIYSRATIQANKCPICSDRIICPIDYCNSIGGVKNKHGDLKYADLIKEFCCIEDVYKYTPFSNKKIFWKCQKTSHHIWEAVIYSRTRNNSSNCSICANKIVCPIDQCNTIGHITDNHGDLKYEYLFEEFVCKKDMYKYIPTSQRKIFWKCRRNSHHIWEAAIYSRTRKNNNGCPICANKFICQVDKCNSIGKVLDEHGELKYNNLLGEFSNKEDMYIHTPSSTKKIPWICKKNPHHEWEAVIGSRTRKNNSNCPICVNKLICPIDQCNSIGKVLDEDGELKYIDVLEEFSDKNKIYKYFPSSAKKVSWTCKKNATHKWVASISHRTQQNASGCPICRKSKGEKIILNILQNNNIQFNTQRKQRMNIKNYSKTRKLCFDFFGKTNNIKFAIEYDGMQHFDANNYFSEKRDHHDSKIRDWLKTLWCTENGVKLLRIHYSDMNSIKKIVTEFISNIEYAEILILSSNPNGEYNFMIGESPPEAV